MDFKAVLIGRSGSGKSYLTNLLSEEFPVISEVAREVLTQYPTFDFMKKQLTMIEWQLQKERTMPRFLSDRGLHDYFIFSREGNVYFPAIEKQLPKRYTHVFALPPREFVKDGVRVEEDVNQAQELYEKIIACYESTGHKVIYLPKHNHEGFIKWALT
jgi:predicted ATPase